MFFSNHRPTVDYFSPILIGKIRRGIGISGFQTSDVGNAGFPNDPSCGIADGMDINMAFSIAAGI